jgi:hypothetical protein
MQGYFCMQQFTVGTKPAANAGPDVNTCQFQQVQIGAPPNPIYAYLWTPAAQVSNPTVSNPFAWTITQFPEEFIVRTTDILTGCVAYDTTYITMRQVDTALALIGQNVYCAPDPSAGILSVTICFQLCNGIMDQHRYLEQPLYLSTNNKRKLLGAGAAVWLHRFHCDHCIYY